MNNGSVAGDFILTGSLVALATMTVDDQALFCHWLQDTSLREQINDHRTPTMEDQMRWFKRVQEPDRVFFSLVTVTDHTLIGNAGFVDIDEQKKEATLRITIGSPEARGKGLGTEAMTLLIQYASVMRRWQRILLFVSPANERAIRTYEKVGFTRLPDGEQKDATLLAMVLVL
ncbi:MAG: GNAT family N-acetyltransferase [Candidatus Peribacteraceae bacterium]